MAKDIRVDEKPKQLNQTYDYEQVRRQSERWTNSSLIAAILGVLILFGAIIAIGAGYVPAAPIAFAMIPEICAVLLLYLLVEANRRAKKQYKKRAIDFIATMKVEGTPLDGIVKTIVLDTLGVPTREPDEYLKVQQFIDDSHRITQYQEKARELKIIHNAFHLLVTAIDPMETLITGSLKDSKSLNIPYLKDMWTPVVACITDLDDSFKTGIQAIAACCAARVRRQTPAMYSTNSRPSGSLGCAAAAR